MAWKLVVFGMAALRPDDGNGPPLTLSRKDAGWLALAALRPGMPSVRAAGMLWPDVDERGAMNNLRQRLHRLRRATGARLCEMGSVLTLAPDLALDAPAPEAALGDDPGAWDAELLAGFEAETETDFAAWLQAERAQRAALRAECLAAHASAAEQAGELARALGLVRRLLAADPLSEHAHRRLMRLHYLRGDTAAAVAAFEACEAVLKDQLGLRPGAETLALLRTVETAMAPTGLQVAPMPASLLRPPRAVGRATALARLAQAHAEGQAVVLVGEAGIGKSRLVHDAAAARGEGRALVVQARPGDGGVPYALVGRLVQALVARIGESAVDDAVLRVLAGEGVADGTAPLAPGAAASALQRLLAGLPAAGCELLALDDLHFADPASLELLTALLPGEASTSLCWLLTHRPPEDAEGAASALRVLEDLEQVCRIVLSPLDEAQLHILLDDLALPWLASGASDKAALAPALVRHTGGNPLFVLETLRALRVRGEPLRPHDLPRPEAIGQLIDRRLRRLSPPALELLRVAAVAGPDFSPALAAFVLGRPAMSLADAWRELEEADVMRGSAFAHDLVHDASLRATPAAIAGHEHGRVAQFLQDQGAAPARVARHWEMAAVWPAAAAAYADAAERACAAGRLREQAGLLQDAARCLLRSGDAIAAAKPAAAAVEALAISAGPDAALACVDQWLDMALPGPAAARLLIVRATVLWLTGRVAEAADNARQALACVGDDEPALQLGATTRLALALAASGDLPAALDLLAPWQARPRSLMPAIDWLHFYGDLTNLLLGAGRFVDARSAAEQHLALARDLGVGNERRSALMNLACMHLLQGDLDAGIAHATEADSLLSDASEQLLLYHLQNRIQLGVMQTVAGDFGQALALLEEGCARLAEQPAALRFLAVAQNHLARTCIILGQPGRAHQLLDGALEALPASVRVARLAAQAELAAALGQDPAPLLRQARSLLGTTGPAHERMLVDLALLPHAGSAADRLVAAAALQQQAQEQGFLGVAAAAGVGRIAALLRLHRLDEVARLLPPTEQAVQRWRRSYLPGLLLVCADAHAALGHQAEARRCLRLALDWVHRVALPTVPLAWRDGFLQRNPDNLALAQRAAADTGAWPGQPSLRSP